MAVMSLLPKPKSSLISARCLQAVLAPVRMLWYLLGRETYMQLYARLDNASGGLDRVGTHYAAPVMGIGIAATIAGVITVLAGTSKVGKA